jgi:hypothetical protein
MGAMNSKVARGPPAHSASNSQVIHFCCQVQGDDTQFIVTVEAGGRRSDLITEVHKARERAMFRDIDAADLTLYKVSYSCQ